MKKQLSFIAILIIITLSFFTGYWYRAKEPVENNPPVKEPQPFSATALSPNTTPDNYTVSLVPGVVEVSPEKQQIMGVQVTAVRKAPGSHVLRILGRVAVDETRTYRINSAVDGWIREIYDNSTGSVVKENEILASFYSPEFLGAQQAYIYALGSLDRSQASSREPPPTVRISE